MSMTRMVHFVKSRWVEHSSNWGWKDLFVSKTNLYPVQANLDFTPKPSFFRFSNRDAKLNTSSEKFKLLLVSDIAHHIEQMTTTLKRETFELTIVRNGLDAMHLLEEIPKFDGVIVDQITFPMSAPMLCQKIRQIYLLYELPILLMVSEQKLLEVDWIFQVGANDIVKVPSSQEEIWMRVMSLCHLKKTVSLLHRTEMRMLVAQLKPHFLFNTLTTMISYCYEDTKKVGNLLMAFTEFLRGSFDFHTNDDWVKLEREINMTKAYLVIEEARFGSRIQIHWHIDSQSINCSIPQMVLQPIVENAIVHGIQSTDRQGHVHIEIELNRHLLSLHVTDNGKGISREQIANILNGESAMQGQALKNIQKRIHMLTGQGLQIQSEYGKGTKVSICIPQKR